MRNVAKDLRWLPVVASTASNSCANPLSFASKLARASDSRCSLCHPPMSTGAALSPSHDASPNDALRNEARHGFVIEEMFAAHATLRDRLEALSRLHGEVLTLQAAWPTLDVRVDAGFDRIRIIVKPQLDTDAMVGSLFARVLYGALAGAVSPRGIW